MLKRRQFIATTSAALAALSFPARAQNAGKLTLWGPPVTPSVLLAIAAREGKAKDISPFEVQIWRSPDQLRAGLVNGEIAASIVPSYVAANLYNQGRKVKLFNIMSEGLNYIAAPVEDGKPLIASLADLAQRSLVIPFKNDMPDLLLQILYKKAGLDFAAAKVSYTATPPEALVLFLSGKVDCANLPEPLMSLAQIKAKEKDREIARALDVQQLWGEAFNSAPRVPLAGLLFTDDFIAQHQDFIAVLNDDLQAAVEWSKAHSDETAKLAAEYLPFPPEALAAGIPHSRFSAIPAASIEAEILNFYTEMHALNAKITGGKVPDAGLFYRG
ncbi:ABC transporter substrate-binding protein [uncultured Cardiobacterium sp.]|uniref:ABC transporter substrate-binding protein n=1 Tax=uncultured Cardiobacterium sp. TaxID=417619 RepID=UPI00262C4DD0|nr:ABC transporter substrate-binding protein [uncultured Cardiobacterium sp.]